MKPTMLAISLFLAIFAGSFAIEYPKAFEPEWKKYFEYKPADWDSPSEDWMSKEDWHQFLICTKDEGDWGTDSCYYAIFGVMPEDWHMSE